MSAVDDLTEGSSDDNLPEGLCDLEGIPERGTTDLQKRSSPRESKRQSTLKHPPLQEDQRLELC